MQIISYTDQYKESVIGLITDILEEELKRHSKSGRPDLYKISEVYQKGRGNFWLAVDNNKVVGTIALSDHGGGRGCLRRFYVAKEFRRRGLGGKLLSALLEFARDNKYKEILLSTQETWVAANNFYNKNGFKKVRSIPKGFTSVEGEIFYRLKL